MSSIGEQHKKLNEFGEGKCSVPMWCQEMPAGFCDNPAYGERPICREFRNAFTGAMQREDGRYGGYVPALACPGHGGPSVRTFMDGNAWCAVGPQFVNLQESPAGFGTTRDEAIAAYELERLKPAPKPVEVERYDCPIHGTQDSEDCPRC